jgi:uridylate kinase
MKKKIVISLGGSIFYPKQFRSKYIEHLGQLLSKYENTQFLISCGGGHLARERMIPGLSNREKDLAGISAVNENAANIHAILKKHIPLHPKVIVNMSEVKKISNNVIAGAEIPGHTSDYDAITMAYAVKVTKVINLSNIDYMYTKNPKKYKTAKPLKKLSWEKFFEIIGTKIVPGGNYPFDPISAKFAEKHTITVQICNGNSLQQVKKAIEGEDVGSIIGKII